MIRVGVAQDVVCEVACDKEALEFLIESLPREDGFTKDLKAAYDEIVALEEARAAYES